MADIHEVHVSRQDGFVDPRGNDVAAELKRISGLDALVKTTTVYRMLGPILTEAQTLATRALADPISEIGQVNPGYDGYSDVRVEVAYHPDITDPVSGSVKKVGELLGVPIEEARVSVIYEFDGISQVQADSFAQDSSLINLQVQEPIYKPPTGLKLVVRESRYHMTRTMNASEDELHMIDVELGTNLGQEKMKAIQRESRKMERDFTADEIHHLGGTWTEHCEHESFTARIFKDGIEKPSFFDRIKETSRKYFKDKVATAFDDNAGGIYFYDGEVVLIKWETHNSPSAIEPKGGAATGSGGVFRDIMGTGQGAQVILSCDVFMTGPTDMDRALVPENCLPPDLTLRGVVAGVRDYGNPMGIPTANGSVYTHEDFRAKPTILVGAYGKTPERYAKKGEPQVGDRVVVIGERTGKDGIFGSNFSSMAMDPDTAVVYGAAVQIGNPIGEKKVGDLILEARDSDFIRALTDCGAAGFASAIGEIGAATGVNVDISNAPIKYEGMLSWEKWMSESQERMVLVVSPENMEAFRKLCDKHEVEATDLGFFDGSNRLQVSHRGSQIIDLDYDFIKNGKPEKTFELKYEQPVFEEPEFAEPQTEEEWIEACKKILSHDNVCSKRPITEQYDSTVQGRTVMGPFAGINHDGPTDAAIIRPILGKPYGMIASHGADPILNRIDPRWGAIWAATEAVSNLVAAGGDFREAALCGNYITPVLDSHYAGAVDMIVDGMSEFQDALEIPVISGKDSVSSTYNYRDGSKLHVPIVLNVSTIGRMEDIQYKMTTSFKKTDSTIVLVGKTHPGMGGSVYYDTHNIVGNDVPKVDLEVLPDTFINMHNGAQTKEIKAAHDNSHGGVFAAIAEMGFGGDLGVDLDIQTDYRSDTFLFNQTSGVFVVEVNSPEEAEELFGDTPHKVIGKTTAEKKYSVNINGRHLFTADMDEFKDAWQDTSLGALFH